jgi:hypothetical protein
MAQNVVLLPFAGVRRIVAAPTVIKAKPGFLAWIVARAAGTITIIDDVTTGGAGTQIYTGTLVLGQKVLLNHACAVGITISAIAATVDVTFN